MQLAVMLLLCVSHAQTLRWFDNKDLQTCFKMIHMLLVMGGEFVSRVKVFLNEVVIMS